MNIKSNLLLIEPINFHNACYIYPPTVKETLFVLQDTLSQYLFPYALSKEVVADEFSNMSILEILFLRKDYTELLIESIYYFCRCKNVEYNANACEIYVDENSVNLNKDNFDEFSEIILESCCREKLKLDDVKEEPPKFETEEGYKRWKKYNDAKKKYETKNTDNSHVDLGKIINIVQLGGGFYISEDEIKKWSLWKLINTYISIVNKGEYANAFNIFVQTGDKELLKTHWTDLLKPM